MDKVVVKALAPNPADRHLDVRSFLAALGAVTLAPAVKQVQPAPASVRCPHCGAENQTGRFCRKCGTRLVQPAAAPQPPSAESRPDEPIQITTVGVGHIEVGRGVEVQQTIITGPMLVTSSEQAELLPKPLPMPQIDLEGLWSTVEEQATIAVPELLPMPIVDWAEIAPPTPEVPVIEDILVSEEDD